MRMQRRMEARGEVGEVRRVHIIYFLSRMGRIEHPHLIRLHHVSRNGIYLRDVKRWLSELRGKNMADSYSWSYKRRYKSGYVWQDLMDDDLITPISDNEFVLKGSEIFTPSFDSCSCRDKIETEAKLQESSGKEKDTADKLPSPYNSSTSTSQTDEDSGPLNSSTSASTEESFKTSTLFTPDVLAYPKTKSAATEIEELNDEVGQKCSLEETDRAKQQDKSFDKKKTKNSNVLRNLLNCGAVDTNDSAVRMVSKNGDGGGYTPMNPSAEICRFDGFGGSERVYRRASWNQQQAQYARNSFSGVKTSKKTNEFGNQKKISAAYKPVREPHCSQCGKAFKPEKLHAHMKSCKGLKSLGRSRATTDPVRSENVGFPSDDLLKEKLLKKQPEFTA